MPASSYSLPLKGKVIALTGGASGIGLAAAHLLASRGATLCLADIQGDPLNTAAETIRQQHSTIVSTCVLDVRSAPAVDAWIASIITQHAALHGAANLAGVVPKSIGVKGIAEQDEDEWDFVLGVNLTGVMHCLRAQVKVIADGGSIVNAASIAGLIGRKNNAAYAASKHGVVGLTKSVAKEVGERGVRVNCVAPGRIITPMSTAAGGKDGKDGKDGADMDAGVALRRPGTAQEAANLIAFLLGDESTFITGATYSIDGGWNC